MVNEGRRSTGCFLCRKRRIRCDEAKPQCQRCVTYGAACPGYRESYVFRSQNNVAERQARKTQKSSSPVLSSSQSVEECTQTPKDENKTEIVSRDSDHRLPSGQANQLTLRRRSTTSLLILDDPHGTISPSLSYSPEQQALCFFIHQHVLPSEEPDNNGHMAFLPDLLRDRLDSPSLQHAVLGVSYLALGCRTGSHELHKEARRNYGKSLSYLRSILSSPSVVMDDAVFAAVLLASLFVDLSGDRQELRNAHASGIYYILSHRGPVHLQTARQKSLFGWGFTQLQIQAVVLATTDPTSELWDNDYIASVCTDNSAKTINAKTITYNILQFYHRSRKWVARAQDPTKRNRKSFLDFIHSARSILREIDIWDSQIPIDWRCVEPETSPSTPSPECNNTPRGRWAASILSLIRACELCFYSSAIGIFTMVDSEMAVEGEGPDLLSDIVQTMKLRVQAVIQDICGNIPLALGNDEPNALQQGQAAGAYHVLWPLWAVINCPFASVEQVQKCREILGCIGSSMGFNLAFLLREARFPLGLG